MSSGELGSDETSLIGVSVIMPVHNAGRYLAAAVRSILEQNHQKLELIVVDDRSTDGAIDQLCTTLSDNRLKVIESKGVGIIDALNFGITESRYDLIARMDSDDIAAPERV